MYQSQALGDILEAQLDGVLNRCHDLVTESAAARWCRLVGAICLSRRHISFRVFHGTAIDI